MERSVNGHMSVLPSLYEKPTMHRKMHRNYRTAEPPAIWVFLERLEPCEGKLSRTVLRGV